MREERRVEEADEGRDCPEDGQQLRIEPIARCEGPVEFTPCKKLFEPQVFRGWMRLKISTRHRGQALTAEVADGLAK